MRKCKILTVINLKVEVHDTFKKDEKIKTN